jgi:dienelactone hydrolase
MPIALAAGIPATGRAQVARIEIPSFQSMTLTDQEFLAGHKDGKPVTLAGELRLPRPGTDRLPAVVLLHGSGGIGGYIPDWQEEFSAIGVATFVIDSFTGRGIVNTLNDQSQLGRLAMIVDAYGALELLATHPRIDPARIALMGFSRGGQAALYAGVRRFQRMYGHTGHEFAAYITFYADCSTIFRGDEDMTNKPVRLFHGSADDYNPVAPCRTYVERLKAVGKDVQLTEYPGVGHFFDARALKKPVKLDKAQTTRRCQLAESGGGVIVNGRTQQPFTYADSCVEYGPTIAYDEKASTEARKAVTGFVTGALRP